MRILEFLTFSIRWIFNRKRTDFYVWEETPFFYQDGSEDCLESLLSDNCSEWASGLKRSGELKGYHYYRVDKTGIDKIKTETDDIAGDTYVYAGNSKAEALLKAIKALLTKSDFKNKRNLKIPEFY